MACHSQSLSKGLVAYSNEIPLYGLLEFTPTVVEPIKHSN
jgi:hypothetical protein